MYVLSSFAFLYYLIFLKNRSTCKKSAIHIYFLYKIEICIYPVRQDFLELINKKIYLAKFNHKEYIRRRRK